MKKFLSLFIFSFLLFVPLVHAQQFTTLEEVEAFLGIDTPEGVDEQKYIDSVNSFYKSQNQFTEYLSGTESCFNYYKFGSVDIDIKSEIHSVIPGVPVTFTALIINNYEYPVIDGSLHLKIFRRQDSDIDRRINGDHLIDQITILEDINLDSGKEKSFIFRWTPQDYLPSGEYYIASFFTTADRYNLLGKLFTDDIIGSKTEFDVVGESKLLYFDKNNIEVAGEEYRFIGAPKLVDSTSPINITVPIVNDTETKKTVSVVWTVYKWDSLRKENLVETDVQKVTIDAGSNKDIFYSVTDTSYPIYLVVPQLISGETLSTLNIRFKREGIDLPRINFPAVTQYPLVGDEEVTLFSCLQNIGGSSQIDDTSLTLSLLDKNGREIHTYRYDRGVTSNIMAVKDVFTPSRDFASFSLLASLSFKGEIVEEVKIDYKCEKLDPSLCSTSFGGGDTIDLIIEVLTKNIVIIGGIFFLLFISILVIIMLMVVKHKKDELNDQEM